MTSHIVVTGDTLEPFASVLEDSDDDGVPTCLVRFIDAAECLTPRAARRRLKERFLDLLDDARSLPALRHVLVLYAHSNVVPAERVHSAAAGLATRLHAELERGHGRYVDVVLLDITGCDDVALLRRRVVEAAESPAGTSGDSALTWDEVRDRSIHDAAMAGRF